MREKLLKLLPKLKGMDEDYILSIENKYKDFLKYSCITPNAISNTDLEITNPKVQNIENNIFTAINDRYNIGINFDGYNSTDILAAKFIDTYFKYCFENDEFLEYILYIDTNLLLEDYKKLMNNSDAGNSPIPVYSTQTLYKDIENAPLVIWNRFSKIKTEYDRTKLYDILLIRQRKGLCNMYFFTGGGANLTSVIDKGLYEMMDIHIVIDASGRDFINNKQKGGINFQC